MMHRWTNLVCALAAICCAALSLLCAPVAPAQAQDVSAQAPKLVIGTMRVPPFVMRGDDGQWSGLSIELWKAVAAEMKAEFEFREFDYDAAGLMDAAEHGQVDAAIAAIPMSDEQEGQLDFSHPYFSAGLGIITRLEHQSVFGAILASIFTFQFLGAMGVLIAVLVGIGSLVWAAEHRVNAQQFDERPAQGIGDGFWWAIVTLTTTGYGDKVPRTWLGRSIAIVWMFASIIFVTLFSGAVASVFVVNQLRTGVQGPADLPRVRIAAVPGTAGEHWINTNGLAARSFPFVIQASKALQRGDVEALIYERSIVGHMIRQYGWQELQVLPHTLAVRDYAIALPTDSRHKEKINRALLRVTQRTEWKEIVQRYIGEVDQKR